MLNGPPWTQVYGEKCGIPLERVETHLERDDSDERHGLYRLRVRVVFHGPLSESRKETLYRVVAKCPIQKLMTTSEVQIETMPSNDAQAVGT